MALGKKTSLAPPCSKLRFFGSKFTALKNVVALLLGFLGAPQWFGKVGGIVTLSPSLRASASMVVLKSGNICAADRVLSLNFCVCCRDDVISLHLLMHLRRSSFRFFFVLLESGCTSTRRIRELVPFCEWFVKASFALPAF